MRNQNVLEKVAGWVVGLSYSDIPPQTVLAARYQILNMISAVYASSQMEETRAIEKAIDCSSSDTGGHSTVLATGKKTNPLFAAAINSAYSMAQDFDDIIWMGHTCHSSVFAPLAVAEHEHRNSKDLMIAVVIANEVAGRLAASSYFGPLNGQMVTYIHLIGAAVATAKLLDLNLKQTAHAMAIALSQPHLPLQSAFMRPSSKLLSASTPIQIGIQSAYLAREGITGALDLLEDRRGFWKKFSFFPLPCMWEDLGSFWALQTLTVKTYPGCHYFQTACSALEQLMTRHQDKSIQRIKKIIVNTTKFGVEASHFGTEYGSHTKEITPVNVNFDLATTLAVLLRAGQLTSHEIKQDWLSHHTDEIRDIRDRIQVRHDPRLTAKVLSGALQVPSGRAAVESLGFMGLMGLKKYYKKEYQSELLGWSDALKWVQIGVESLLKKESKEKIDSTPLYFPSRVEIQFDDQSHDSLQIDLPEGSFASSEIENVLFRKLMHEGRQLLKESQLKKTWELGLRLESIEISEFVKTMSFQ